MTDTKANRATPWLLALLILLLSFQFLVHRPRWEYRTGRFGSYEDDPGPSLAEELKRLGDDGWEMVSFETISWGDDQEPVAARVALRRRVRGP